MFIFARLKLNVKRSKSFVYEKKYTRYPCLDVRHHYAPSQACRYGQGATLGLEFHSAQSPILEKRGAKP
jgi:hypothetical protein